MLRRMSTNAVINQASRPLPATGVRVGVIRAGERERQRTGEAARPRGGALEDRRYASSSSELAVSEYSTQGHRSQDSESQQDSESHGATTRASSANAMCRPLFGSQGSQSHSGAGRVPSADAARCPVPGSLASQLHGGTVRTSSAGTVCSNVSGSQDSQPHGATIRTASASVTCRTLPVRNVARKLPVPAAAAAATNTDSPS